MKLGIDIDGVLANFTDAYTELLFKESGVRLPPASDEWPTEWQCDRVDGITAKHRSAAWDHINSTDWQARHLPIKGALQAIQRLNIISATGNSVYFITSRGGDMAKFHTETWLRFHGSVLPTVLIANRKGPVAAGLELDVFVDDKLQNIDEVREATCGECFTRCYLIDRPYNQKNGYTRASSLGAVLDIEFPLMRMKEAA